MLIIPAIDLLHGRAVRLLQGDYNRVIDFGDPLTWIARWQAAGAELIHVVDLDGARAGRPMQRNTIAQLATVGLPLQVGGGVRTLQDVTSLIEVGAQRVVLGTAAVEDRIMLAATLDSYRDRIVVALDARAGFLVTHGWEHKTPLRATELARELAAMDIPRFLYTDVQRDGTLTEPNYAELAALKAATERPIIASGGIASLAAIERLRQLGMEAAIIGRALYEGLVDFTLAQEVAHAG
jgi:phosphoribosylformimino-5-aminoimidazole carboxamide ribotide isomerase